MRIPLDRHDETPIYQQIGTYLRQTILSGSLSTNTRLPACRQLAHDLGVNRSTIENAYSALEAEGLVFSRMGSGTYVLQQEAISTVPKHNSNAYLPLWQQNFHTQNVIHTADMVNEMLQAAGHSHPINFSSGISDARQFPAEEFRKTLQTVMRRDEIAALDYGEPNGY